MTNILKYAMLAMALGTVPARARCSVGKGRTGDICKWPGHGRSERKARTRCQGSGRFMVGTDGRGRPL